MSEDADHWVAEASLAMCEAAMLSTWSLELMARAVGPELLDRVHAMAERAALRSDECLAKATALDSSARLSHVAPPPLGGDLAARAEAYAAEVARRRDGADMAALARDVAAFVRTRDEPR